MFMLCELYTLHKQRKGRVREGWGRERCLESMHPAVGLPYRNGHSESPFTNSSQTQMPFSSLCQNNSASLSFKGLLSAAMQSFSALYNVFNHLQRKLSLSQAFHI